MTEETAVPGKLVRDRIPEIIRQAGSVPRIETAPPHLRDSYLRRKLSEELAEYLASGVVEELADIVEVCFSAAKAQGVAPDALLDIAQKKREQRGGFDRWLVWLGNE
ncbi:hypothetical protein DMB66_23230 [Actinoplanes sp. ATCC 53533]|uniref:nucleoside triphosphate pyrophosphohydrolase n=1 Tax=Actinoplanes sp. ATCC 53533 TaxID=1288362 RepID=UPI000F766DFA|nr:nucleoside triphosphate pyrophosphohydrolase [Actinoplanes sp. ATCC 53533]RSM61979.1 hypothetical protein DMB66_23230 [Actinoplanes sp. ATCC 53533]